MIHPDILAALARERSGTFLAEAEAVRRARQAIHACVFIVLGGIQIVATAFIMVYAARYQDTPCPVHLPRQPGAKTATATGCSGNEPSSWRRPGRSIDASAAPAGHGRALRAYVPVLHLHSHAVTESQAAHLEGKT